jgi:uncharacterized protein
MGEIERRAAQTTVSTDDSGLAFSGYVLKWGALSEDLGGFREMFLRGAFAEALASPDDLSFILDHEKLVRNVLGQKNDGSLLLVEDEIGLAFLAHPADTQVAQDAAKIVKKNRMGVSFGFAAAQERWGTTADGSKLRTVTNVSLLDDVSIVVDPAYRSSEISVVRKGKRKRQTARNGATIDFLKRELALAELEFSSSLRKPTDR